MFILDIERSGFLSFVALLFSHILSHRITVNELVSISSVGVLGEQRVEGLRAGHGN